MYRDHRIAVNISAFNEQALINKTLAEVPDFVDIIVVVDDCSKDSTCWFVEEVHDPRIKLIRSMRNGGFGAVTIKGYQYLMNQHIDIVANLNGDGQMDARALPAMLDLMITNFDLDLVKGDRLSHPSAGRMPLIRRFGGHLLSWLTSCVTGYEISDSQHTYHVIKMDALKRLRLNRLYPRFGYPNDFLIECAKQGLWISNYPTRAIYDNGQKSTLKPLKVAPRILWILAKGYVQIRAKRLARRLDMRPDESLTY